MLRQAYLLNFSEKENTQRIVAWIIVSFFTVFQLLLELVTNTIASNLASSFKINHASVGILSSAFFYTFLAMQLPVGIILNRFNIRNVLTIACCGCGIGCILFATSTSFISAIFSRMMMGLFGAFGFLGLLKISSSLFSARYFPFLVGLSQFWVMSVTSVLESVIARSVLSVGWRITFIGFGCVGIFISFLIAIFLAKNKEHKSSTFQINNYNIKLLFTNKNYLFACLIGFGLYSFIAVFNGLWGIEFLKNVYHFSAYSAALCISISLAGTALGCAAFGIMASVYNKTTFYLRNATVITIMLLIFLASYPAMSLVQTKIIMFFLGFWSGAFFLCFDVAKKSVPRGLEDLALAFCNICVMASALLLQPLMGMIIDMHTNKLTKLTINFSAVSEGFRLSLLLFVIPIFIAWMGSYSINKGLISYNN